MTAKRSLDLFVRVVATQRADRPNSDLGGSAEGHDGPRSWI